MSIFSCKDTVGLVSASLDRGLALGHRLAMRFHLLMCRDCSRFHRQMLFVDEAASRLVEEAAGSDMEQPRLSAAARDRINSVLEQNNS